MGISERTSTVHYIIVFIHFSYTSDVYASNIFVTKLYNWTFSRIFPIRYVSFSFFFYMSVSINKSPNLMSSERIIELDRKNVVLCIRYYYRIRNVTVFFIRCRYNLFCIYNSVLFFCHLAKGN